MTTEYDINSSGSSKRRSRYIPARYVFAAISMLGTFLMVLTRSAMPVAITAMVRRNITITERDNDTDPDTCPSGAVQHNESSVSVSGPLMPAGSIISASWVPPQERQQLGGIMLSAANLGSIVSTVLTGVMVENLGWQSVFYIFSGINLAWLALWIFFVYDSPDKHPRISEEERVYITESTKKDETQAARKLPWKEILLSVPFWAYIIMCIPGNWLSITLSMALPSYLTNMLHYSTTEAGYFSALPSVFSWFSVVVSGILSQWIRRKKHLGHLVTYHIFNGVATLGSAAIMLFLTLANCNKAATIALFCLAFVTSSAYIGGSQLNHMDIAVNYAGTLSGLSSMLMGLVGIVAPIVSGALTNNKQTLTAWKNVFYVIAAVNIVPFFVYLFFGSVDEQPWNQSQHEVKGDTSKSKPSTVEIEDVK